MSTFGRIIIDVHCFHISFPLAFVKVFCDCALNESVLDSFSISLKLQIQEAVGDGEGSHRGQGGPLTLTQSM